MDENLFAERVQRLREQRGLGMTELARRTGLSRDALYRIQRREREGSPLYVAVALARALATSIDYLLGLTDDPAPSGVPGVTPELELQALVKRLNALPPARRARIAGLVEEILDLTGPDSDPSA